MAETTGSLSRREMRERGKGVKTTPVDTEMEALGLSSIPAFERPQSAGPKDRWVGEDELGNQTYETVTGVRYTIKPNPDQRTTRAKVEEGVQAWNEAGRPLPSREQVIETAKQIPQAAYESVASAVRGEGTLGDVAGMAPAVPLAKAIAAGPRVRGLKGEAEPMDLSEVYDVSGDPVYETKPTTLVNNPNTYNPKYNPLVVPYDTPPLTPTIEFYNPIETTIQNMDFGKKGLTGETLVAFIEKRAPSVRTSLIRGTSSGVQLFDPKKRYTKEEALKIIQDNSWTINVNEHQRYGDYQRQPDETWGAEESYVELTLDAGNPDKALRPVMSTHYDPSTLGHTRLSTRVDEDGNRYLLVEELQSDPMQGKDSGYSAPTSDELKSVGRTFTPEEEHARRIAKLSEQYSNTPHPDDRASIGAVLSDEITTFANRYGISQYDWDTDIDSIIERDGVRAVARAIGRDFDPTIFQTRTGLPPVESTTEVVRPLVLAAIRHAQNEGMDTIVFPPLEYIVSVREGASRDALKTTYEDSLKKVLKELERERGVDVSLFTHEVPSPEKPPKIQIVLDSDLPDSGVARTDFFNPVMTIDEVLYDLSNRNDDGIKTYIRQTIEEIEQDMQIAESNLRLTSDPYEIDFLTRELEGIKRNLARMSRPEFENEFISFVRSGQGLDGVPSGSPFPETVYVDDPDWKPTGKERAIILRVDSFPDGRLRFAKGGEVKKDPVSGNKVPPNGTAKGVRDDVPALLSEGEYVIPENVVNTYGAKTFDRLVQQTNDMLKTQPGKVQKMAEGGFVENPTEADIVSGFNPDAYRTVGYSYFGGTAPTTQVSYTYVTYINANGDTIQIRVDANGNPLDPIPAGYMTMEAYQAQLQNTREEGNTTEEQQDDFTSYYTYDEEQFKQMLEDPSGLEKTMLDLFGGGIFGGLIEQDRITNLEAAAVVANDLGYTDVAQELLDKSKTLASEAGKPSKLTEWLSADAANVVDRHRKAAPEGLLGTLSLTPVEPGKPISLDGRTPPPEAFTSTGIPATTTPAPVINPGQLPLASTPAPTPTPTTIEGTTMESINDPAFGGAVTPTPSPTPVETTTLPPAPTAIPTTTAYQGKSIVPADPRNAYSAWDQMVVGGMPEGYNQNPSIPTPAPFKQQTPDVAGFTQPNASQGFAPVPNTTTDASPVGRSPVGPSYPFVQQSTLTPGPQPVVGPTYIPAPTPPAPVPAYYANDPRLNVPMGGMPPAPTPTYYANDPRLNVPTGGMPAAPQSVAVSTVAPTQPQVPGVIPQYYPGIDQGVATNPVMPGELFATPTIQAPTVGVAPVVDRQPPAGGRSSVSVPINPPAGPPTTSSEVLTARIPPNLMAAPDADYRAPTLPTPTPTSEDSAPPSGEPPIPPGTTTAEKIGPGSVVPVMQLTGENPLPGDWIPEGSKINAATEQSPVSVSDGISVRRADPGSTAAVVMFEGEQYVIPKGETVLVAGQTVSYAGGETVNINGLNGGVTDVFPRDAFGKQFGTSNFVPPAFPREAYPGKESFLAPTTSPIPPARPSVEPTTSQKNTAPATKPPEVSWSSLTDLTPSNLNRGSLEQTIGFQTDPSNSANIEKIINYAESVGVDPAIALGLAQVESQFNPNATSKKAGHGLFQVTPKTAVDPGYGVSPLEGTHGKETVDANIKFGIDYLKGMYEEFGNWEDALKAYNQGPGKTKEGELEPETRDYVPDVFRAADSWEQVLQNIEEETKKGFEDIEKVTGESDFADLRFDDESIFSDGDSTSSGGSSSNKTPTPVPTTTNLTTLSFGDTISTPTGGGNVAPIEDYDRDNQPFAKGGLVKRRPAKYSKGGLVKRRIMATRK